MVVFTSVLLGLLFVLFISAVFLFRHFSLHKYRFYDSITKQRPSLKTAINAKVAHKQENNAEKLSSIEKLGEWCQEECLTLGHSDQCWLPRQVICHNKDKTLQSYQVKNLYSATYTLDIGISIKQDSTVYLQDTTLENLMRKTLDTPQENQDSVVAL